MNPPSHLYFPTTLSISSSSTPATCWAAFGATNLWVFFLFHHNLWALLVLSFIIIIFWVCILVTGVGSSFRLNLQVENFCFFFFFRFFLCCWLELDLVWIELTIGKFAIFLVSNHLQHVWSWVLFRFSSEVGNLQKKKKILFFYPFICMLVITWVRCCVDWAWEW